MTGGVAEPDGGNEQEVERLTDVGIYYGAAVV